MCWGGGAAHGIAEGVVGFESNCWRENMVKPQKVCCFQEEFYKLK